MTYLPNWRNLDYLQNGNVRQRQVYHLLNKTRLMDRLLPYDAALVSTVCVGWDLPDSDLDIIVNADRADNSRLGDRLKQEFSHYADFSISRWDNQPWPVICRFSLPWEKIELFAYPTPLEQQAAWRHLTQMQRLANLLGKAFSQKVKELKKAGSKTEPAIAKLLGLAGEPFQAVLDLEKIADKQIAAKWQENINIGFLK